MRLRLCVALIALSIATPAAFADTFNLQFSGAGEAGSVLLTAGATATAGTFLVTSASGLIDTESVSLLPRNTYPAGGPNDNLLFFSASAVGDSLDLNGLSFLLTDGTEYNLYQQAGQYFATIGPQLSVATLSTLTVTRAAASTPEPAPFLLLGTGLLAFACAVHRRTLGPAAL